MIAGVWSQGAGCGVTGFRWTAGIKFHSLHAKGSLSFVPKLAMTSSKSPQLRKHSYRKYVDLSNFVFGHIKSLWTNKRDISIKLAVWRL